MVIIPEIEKVLILVPKAASTSLKNAILNRYRNSFLIYRHMEADGVPRGYDRWEKLGVVRDPIERLWSLYNFLKDFEGAYHKSYIEKQRASVANMDFSEWIIRNEVVFTGPYDCSGSLKFYPKYTVGHPLPENKKSQYIYLRPDLGTKIFRFTDLDKLVEVLGLSGLPKLRASQNGDVPAMMPEAMKHVWAYFKWDIYASGCVWG